METWLRLGDGARVSAAATALIGGEVAAMCARAGVCGVGCGQVGGRESDAESGLGVGLTWNFCSC